MRLPRTFYRRASETLAKALLGQRFVHVVHGERLAGLIVETEAYLGVPDAAAHTYGGRRTDRVKTMWADGGRLYVYFIYGVHDCMNVVASTEGDPSAVLVRALEPIEGLDAMRRNRGHPGRDTMLCSGPGKLCRALGITRAMDGTDLVTSDTCFIERERARVLPVTKIVATARVGVGYAGEWAVKPLRFYVKGNPHVSRP